MDDVRRPVGCHAPHGVGVDRGVVLCPQALEPLARCHATSFPGGRQAFPVWWPMTFSRRYVVAALGLALILCIGAAAPAAAKPLVCKKGFGKLVLQGKAQCVAAAKLVPPAAAAPSAYARWMRIALDRQLGTALEKHFVKPRLRGRSELRAASVLKPLRARSAALGASLEGKLDIETLRAVRAPRATTTTTGPVTVTQSGNTASVHGSMQSRDAAAGTTSTLDVTGRVTVDPATGRETSARSSSAPA